LDVVETLVHDGVEHHLVLVPGHHAAPLREAAAWSGAKHVPVRSYGDALAPTPPVIYEEDRV
jgi:hypothetical protein